MLSYNLNIAGNNYNKPAKFPLLLGNIKYTDRLTICIYDSNCIIIVSDFTLQL